MRARSILSGLAFGACITVGGGVGLGVCEALPSPGPHQSADTPRSEVAPVKEPDPEWPLRYKIGAVIVGIYAGAFLGADLVLRVDPDKQ